MDGNSQRARLKIKYQLEAPLTKHSSTPRVRITHLTGPTHPAQSRLAVPLQAQQLPAKQTL